MAEVELARALASVRRALVPPTEEEIAKALAAMAAMFQVPIPDSMGIHLYALALNEIPAPAFKLACREVLKTHAYPRLPYPAEILKAAGIHADLLTAYEGRFTQALAIIHHHKENSNG